MPALKRGRAQRNAAVKKTDPDAHDPTYSRAVKKALETLELLQASSSPLPLNEVAQRIELSKTSAFRLLRTLEAEGCLTVDPWGRYLPVPEMRNLLPSQFLAKLLRVAIPLMRDLSANLRETISLAALFDNRVEAIAVVESPETIRMSNVVGHIIPPNSSSLGKVITAFQNEERREKLLRSFGVYRFTPKTITDRAQLYREYERIRAQKFAADHEESVCDGCCFAVPLFGESGAVSLAVSVSLPKVRLRNSEHEKAMIDALWKFTEEVAGALRIPSFYNGTAGKSHALRNSD